MRALRPCFFGAAECCVIGAQRGSEERRGAYSAAAKDCGIRNKNERVGGAEHGAGDGFCGAGGAGDAVGGAAVLLAPSGRVGSLVEAVLEHGAPQRLGIQFSAARTVRAGP